MKANKPVGGVTRWMNFSDGRAAGGDGQIEEYLKVQEGD